MVCYWLSYGFGLGFEMVLLGLLIFLGFYRCFGLILWLGLRYSMILFGFLGVYLGWLSLTSTR